MVLKVQTGKEWLLNRVQGIMRPYVWAGVLRLSKLKVVLNDGQGNRYLLMQGTWPCTQTQAHKHGRANMGTQSQAHKHGHAITGA